MRDRKAAVLVRRLRVQPQPDRLEMLPRILAKNPMDFIKFIKLIDDSILERPERISALSAARSICNNLILASLRNIHQITVPESAPKSKINVNNR